MVFLQQINPELVIIIFADIDCDFISIHHWMKWYKFGFTRSFDNLAIEIRNKRLTRSEAIDILKQQEDTPYDDIEKFCKFANIKIDFYFLNTLKLLGIKKYMD